MSVALHTPRMSRAEFLDWIQWQEVRHEFDGVAPVATTGGTLNRSLITINVLAALRARLRGGPCRVLGPDAGLATAGDAVRYPDALVTCTPFEGTDRLVPGATVAIEVLSPTSGRTDRVVKLREYRAVPTLRAYALLEHTEPVLTLFARTQAGADWTATALTAEDTLHLPAIGIEVPVSEFYADVAFPPPG